jgi:hypothetical protein
MTNFPLKVKDTYSTLVPLSANNDGARRSTNMAGMEEAQQVGENDGARY